jgi:peptidoglycan/LPS O-acetylase OafA/YrhL
MRQLAGAIVSLGGAMLLSATAFVHNDTQAMFAFASLGYVLVALYLLFTPGPDKPPRP